MVVFVGVLLLVAALVSLVALIVTFFRRVPLEKQNSAYIERKRVWMAREMWSFSMCMVGFIFLASGFVTPLGALLTVAGMEALGYAVALVNFSELLGK